MSTKAVINLWRDLLGYTEDKDRVSDIIESILRNSKPGMNLGLIKTLLFAGEWDAKKAIVKFTDWLQRNISEYHNGKKSLPGDTLPNLDLDPLNKSGMHPVQWHYVMYEAIYHYATECGHSFYMYDRWNRLLLIIKDCITESQIGPQDVPDAAEDVREG